MMMKCQIIHEECFGITVQNPSQLTELRNKNAEEGFGKMFRNSKCF